jgi:hypothetical protein
VSESDVKYDNEHIYQSELIDYFFPFHTLFAIKCIFSEQSYPIRLL